MKTGLLSLFGILFQLSVLSQPLSGTYTIGGTTPDYATFNAAAAALELNGVSGPVVFNIRNGTYNESVYLTTIAGSSATNTITFQSESGDSSQVLMTYSGPANTFQWDTAHYVIFRKFSLRNTNVSNYNALAFAHRGHNIVVENCNLSGLNGNQGRGLSFGDADSCVYIRNNRITNCLNGIGVYGNPNFPTLDAVVENNYVTGGDRGIQMEEVLRIVMRYNYVIGGFRGFMADGVTMSECHHNTFRTGGGTAITLLGVFDPGNGNIRIENNLIMATGSSSAVNNSFAAYQCDDIEFINNTVYLNSTYTTQSAFQVNLVDSVFIYNNIIMNNGTGYAVQFGGNVWSKNSDYNVIFTNGAFLAPGISNATQWRSTYLIDYNSQFVNPQFVNISNDFHPTNPVVDGLADPAFGISDDLIGIPRHPQYPDPGCYEFSIMPNANLGADQTLCGDSLILSAGNNGSYYLWNTGETTQSITANASGSYWVQITNLAGVDRDTVNITLNPFPTLVLSANDSVCAGDSTQLVATSNATTFSWLPVAGLDNPSASIVNASPASSTTYTLTVTDVNGCTGADNVGVTVFALPIANAGNDQSICAGNQVQIGTGSSSNCLWSPATGLSSTSDCQPFASPSSSEVYSLLITDVHGCTDTDTVTVTVNPLPALTACCNQALCPGDTVSLTASSSANTISWSPSVDLSSSTGSTVDAYPVSTTTVHITATDSNGCMMSDSIVLTVYPAPPVPVITQSGLDLMSSEGNGVQWYLNGNIINGATNQYYTPLQNGNYTVAYTDSNGCSATSAVYYFGSVNNNEIELRTPVVYYDQQEGALTVAGFTDGIYRMNIYNAIGQVVFTKEIAGSSTATRYDLNLNEGIYVISLEGSYSSVAFRIVASGNSSVR